MNFACLILSNEAKTLKVDAEFSVVRLVLVLCVGGCICKNASKIRKIIIIFFNVLRASSSKRLQVRFVTTADG